jgi:hypothetical protein
MISQLAKQATPENPGCSGEKEPAWMNASINDGKECRVVRIHDKIWRGPCKLHPLELMQKEKWKNTSPRSISNRQTRHCPGNDLMDAKLDRNSHNRAERVGIALIIEDGGLFIMHRRLLARYPGILENAISNWLFGSEWRSTNRDCIPEDVSDRKHWKNCA